MYVKKKLNIILLATGFAGLIVFFLCIQQQAVVGDKQFLKSMIPHHAAAVLMVKQTELNDPEIKKLGQQIIESQQAEIKWMKARLKELQNK